LTAKSLAEIDEWQTEMQLKATRLGDVEMYTTGLTVAERRITCVTIAPDIEAAIGASIARHEDPHVAFIPEGPYVVPIYAPVVGERAA
jgi:lactate racemase